MSIFIIAEAGVNHNGSSDLALQLVDAASKAGADAIKFQTFRARNIATRKAGLADYQKTTNSIEDGQYAMLERLELDAHSHKKIFEHCKDRKIEFLSTPFDIESVKLLIEKIGVTRLKIPSGEITNAPLLLECSRSGLPIIMSTGMALLSEIESALGILAFGYINKNQDPWTDSFKNAYISSEGQGLLKEKVTLLHCTTEYPAPFDQVNLRVMETLRRAFGLKVGYSDHTSNITAALAAAALGAEIIEKHFTIDKDLPGPDHKASLTPDELKAMIEGIKQVEMIMGNSEKIPVRSEIKNIPIARKSLVASVDIKKGEIFTEKNITAKRPGTGVSPMLYWDILGKKAHRDYEIDEFITI
ncbi:MAG: N-acetylneuraminate synthase [Nitrospirae bacterium]|nr:N-acetylneuraminate synthase [Nitrospirota bacterium]